MGRRKLVGCSGFTESMVRTELEKLKELGLVEMGKHGTHLTPKGKKELANLSKVKDVKELELVELKLDRFNIAALLRGIERIEGTWKYRDLAVREGANSVLFFRYCRGYINLADSGESIDERNPKDALAIRKTFDIQQGDFILVVFAKERKWASKGLWGIISKL